MMDTAPMPLESMSQGPAGLDDFRITSPAQIKAMLRTLVDGAIPLSINGPDGAMLGAALWTVDTMREAISFSATPDDPHLQSILQSNEAVVVGYLDNVKLQFDANDLVLVHAGRTAALSCALPTVMYRFQRRNAYRVRPVTRSSPTARFTHPRHDQINLALRILDVSLGGCALLLPHDVPALDAGITLREVEFDFDADTRFTATLRLHHLSTLGADAQGLRMGCEMVRLPSSAERLLQRYIDQTQKRRRLMALD